MPNIAPGLLHVHMPKTAGTFVGVCFHRELSGRRVAGGHDPAWTCGPDLRDNRLAFGTIRDPWSWYASWYQHARRNGGTLRHSLGKWGRGKDDFRSVLYGVTHPEQWVYGHQVGPASPGVIWHPRQGDAPYYRGLDEVGDDWDARGLWSYAVRYFYGDRCPGAQSPTGAAARGGTLPRGGWGVSCLLDAPTLREALSDLAGKPLQTERRNAAEDMIGVWQFDRPYPEVYDEDMIHWVAEADGSLATALGYVTPFGPNESPVIDLSEVGAVMETA